MKVATGTKIPHTPGSALTADDVVVLVDLIGIATEDIAAGELGSLEIEGIFELAKNNTQAMPAGTIVYWDDTGNKLTTTSTSNKVIGKMSEAAATGDTTGRVRLTP